ncbi:MAG: hypothetical protein RH862_11135 [Leptospiraceae bacterium]
MKRTLPAVLLSGIILGAGIVCTPLQADAIGKDCTFKGTPLKGKVKVVDSFPDFKVKVVESFPDLKVKTVDSFPDDCGEWKFVDSFPDFTVKFVESFPDFEIKMVTSFPGLP